MSCALVYMVKSFCTIFFGKGLFKNIQFSLFCNCLRYISSPRFFMVQKSEEPKYSALLKGAEITGSGTSSENIAAGKFSTYNTPPIQFPADTIQF